MDGDQGYKAFIIFPKENGTYSWRLADNGAETIVESKLEYESIEETYGALKLFINDVKNDRYEIVEANAC